MRFLRGGPGDFSFFVRFSPGLPSNQFFPKRPMFTFGWFSSGRDQAAIDLFPMTAATDSALA